MGTFPEGAVDRATFDGEADEPPARVRAEGLDDFDGLIGGERVLEDGGIAQQAVEFGKDEFGDRHVFLALNGGRPRARVVVPRRGRVEGV
ncbi:MAG TPA: hypothetical protein PLX89_18375 [Verrucomicrobiota bacterium]|nr:hypothetical protein [Verrucomicrobiota bacterium]